jgi:hypothetical protein
LTFFRDQEVAWLDVAVDQSVPMGMTERHGRLVADIRGSGRRQPADLA